MNIKMSISGLDKVDNLFTGLKKQMKPEVIDRGLDAQLAKDLAELKAKMLTTVNKEIRSQIPVQTKDAGETEVNIRKSDEEMVKHLTGVDLSKLAKTRDYNTLADGNVAVVSNKDLNKATIDKMNGGPTSKMSSGVNLRLPMSEFDTFENQYSQALNYYNNAIFVFVDNNGKSSYYINPGIDLSQYVKVVCSKEGGNTEGSNNRWDKHRDKRGYADWTLFSSGVEAIKDQFINITDVVEKLKEGQYDEAKGVLNKVSQKSNRTFDYAEKIDNLKNNDKLDPSVESYNNLIRLLKNLQIEKSIKNDRTFYTLVSTYDENTKDFQNFQETLLKEVRFWKITNEQKWVSTLVKAIVALSTKLLR